MAKVYGIQTQCIGSPRKRLGSFPALACSEKLETRNVATRFVRKRATRVYLLDVQPLCYRGSTPSPREFVFWIEPFLTRIVQDAPVVAVFDGQKGNEWRKEILSTYKAGRRQFKPLDPHLKWTRGVEASLPCIHDFLAKCGVCVVKIDNAEADDVVATLAHKIVEQNLNATVASPDKDFKQLVSENVHLLIPLPDLRRWSFYTVKDYVVHHGCQPTIELGLRSMLGDAADGVPGVPGFARKTALKLMKKYGTLENLLSAAAVRTVGKPYIQDALREHASLLETNLKILSLRRDVEVTFPEQAYFTRDRSNDLAALHCLKESLM